MQFLTARLNKKVRIGSEKGFTLIETITVIVLLGIVGIMGSNIIATTFKGFSETDASMELFEEGKLALMRMEREIHHMVPNAVETPTNDSIHFGLIDVNTLTSAATPITGQYEPVGSSKIIKDLSLNPLAAHSTLLSIYNTSWNDFASTAVLTRKIYDIDSIDLVTGAMTLDKEIIGGHSATKRYYPVQKAVRYYVNGTTLYRAETPVTLAPDDFSASFPVGVPLLGNIDISSSAPFTFSYTPASLTSNALVSINFTLAKKGTILNFHKEIQVRNVP